MSLESTPRNLVISLSKGNINDAFTSLLLATGHLHEGEVITDVSLPRVDSNIVGVSFTINKEVDGN